MRGLSAVSEGKARTALLVFDVAGSKCALPLQHVEETLRPLPIEPVSGVPDFVLGLSIIRGVATPVVHAGMLIRGNAAPPARLITVKSGGRRVALAVNDVVGVVDVAVETGRDLPPLVRDGGAGAIASIGALDTELFTLLQSARLVPDETWAAIDHESRG